VQQIVDAILSLPEGSRITLLAPKVRRKKGEHKEVFEAARKAGFVRVRVNGNIHLLDDPYSAIVNLDKQKWHYIELVIDRLTVRPETEQSRVAESVETALREGDGVTQVLRQAQGERETKEEELVFSEQFACARCGISLPEIEPRTFSFNSPHGACPACTGLGYKLEVDPELVIPNKSLSLSEGAVAAWSRAGSSSGWYLSMMESVAKAHGFSARTPVKDLTREQINLVLYGNQNRTVTVRHKTQQGRTYSWETSFEGVIPNLERRYKDTDSDYIRQEIERYMAARPCQTCGGKRLRPGHYGRDLYEHWSGAGVGPAN
jgi:excinuclease ABC subunit A